MKRKAKLLISILLMTILMLHPLQAAGLDLVCDETGLLTGEESSKLSELAQDITDRYGCELSIVIVDQMDGGEAKEAAKSIYQEYDYGYGDEKSGMMFFLSPGDRDYALVAFGYGNTALTDHGREVILEKHILPALGSDNYYEAFTAYLNQAAEYLEMADKGAPFDVDTDEGFPWTMLGIVLIAPILIAAIVGAQFLAQMETAVAQQAADKYIPQGGFNLIMQADHFLYRTEVRTKREKESSSGGTSSDSDGFSGSSGSY